MAVGTVGPAAGVAGAASGAACHCCTLTVLSKMQSLDPEEFLVDEEDDIFGEGKHVFLTGAVLVCFAER